jgi:hypothetical protein
MSRTTSSFMLAAIVAILFNTALACAKDASPPLTHAMTALTGHHWTTHGLADLAVFAVLGLAFMKTGVTERIRPDRLIWSLTGAVAAASCGLALWYVFF